MLLSSSPRDLSCCPYRDHRDDRRIMSEGGGSTAASAGEIEIQVKNIIYIHPTQA